MVKIIYRVVVKKNLVEEFQQLAKAVLIPEAQKLSGCLLISMFQNSANSREFIFYEKWKSESDIVSYKQNLISVLGPTNPGEEFPAKLNDFFEEDEDL